MTDNIQNGEGVELLPCPFCGKPGDIEQGPASQASGSHCAYRGWCDECSYGLDWTTDQREATASWNTRVAHIPYSATLELYLIWSNEHSAWWGKDRCGYTRFIDRAGRYDRAEALSIAGTRGGGWHVRKGNPDEIAIPEQDAIDQYASITQSQRDDESLTLGASA